MAVVKARESDIDLLARLLRAEAEGEGIQGMLHVGAVGVNRIRANCSDFVGIRTVPQMIYQPHAFEAVIHGYFYQRARESERRLARRAIRGRDNGPPNTAYGISARKETVPLNGMASRLSLGINHTVFMSRREKNVRIFTAPFELFANPQEVRVFY